MTEVLEPVSRRAAASRSFESYVDDVWWPNLRLGMSEKVRIRHRRDVGVAIELLRYSDGDARAPFRLLVAASPGGEKTHRDARTPVVRSVRLGAGFGWNGVHKVVELPL